MMQTLNFKPLTNSIFFKSPINKKQKQHISALLPLIIYLNFTKLRYFKYLSHKSDKKIQKNCSQYKLLYICQQHEELKKNI